MNMSEIGQVQAYLLHYRMIERHPQGRPRRPARQGLLAERDAEELLAGATEAEKDRLRQLLAGLGLRLTILEDSEYPGISPGNCLYLLQRHADGHLPGILSRQPVLEALRLRQESQALLSVWYLQLWLLLLSLLYTRYNRALSDVSRYQEATFQVDELIDSVQRHLEHLRQHTDQGDQREWIEALVSARGEDISRRCRAFVGIMQRAGLIEKATEGEEVWQQTLLGALDTAETGLHHLRHLIDEVLPALPDDEALSDHDAQTEYAPTADVYDDSEKPE